MSTSKEVRFFQSRSTVDRHLEKPGHCPVSGQRSGESRADAYGSAPGSANGLILNIAENCSPGAPDTKLSYLAATPKPRLLKVAITPEGEERVSVGGSTHKATRFKVKPELGGLRRLIASLGGKQPADTDVWVGVGEAPAFVKSQGPQYIGGPIWTIELSTPV